MKVPAGRNGALPPQKSIDEKLHDVSKDYEKHFLGEMMKAMRSTVHESGFLKSNNAEKIFRDQLDQEYVSKWGDKGGIGLADLIYKQMVEKYGVQMGLKAPVQKPQGPLPLTAKDQFTAKPFHQKKNTENLSYRFDKSVTVTPDASKPMDVTSPWDGILADKKTLQTGETLLEVKHDNGLKSQLVFKGVANAVKPGQKIQAGETLGLLSPEAKTFFWHTQTGPQEAATVSE
ncbi:rod-binding protein [Bdellovibrio sp. HCB337]|uniref:rod-binding protein n=1 Tax=Bdellovibrio sp. HCB337 TaxID=3394358 RepID=UPI0039A6851D